MHPIHLYYVRMQRLYRVRIPVRRQGFQIVGLGPLLVSVLAHVVGLDYNPDSLPDRGVEVGMVMEMVYRGPTHRAHFRLHQHLLLSPVRLDFYLSGRAAWLRSSLFRCGGLVVVRSTHVCGLPVRFVAALYIVVVSVPVVVPLLLVVVVVRGSVARHQSRQ